MMSTNRIDRTLSRRAFLEGTAVAAGASALLGSRIAAAEDAPASLAAKPPAGFSPMTDPGKVVRVTKSDVLQPNKLFPKPDAAHQMLERAMLEFTGETDLAKAFGRFVHKDDKVAVKLNGIAGQSGATMATNKELVLPIVEGIVAAGVPPTSIIVYEQYTSFLNGTRVREKDLPPGVKTVVHGNSDATMREIRVSGVRTKFVRPLTEATAVINVSLMKDHSICGYTGCLKNMTHGSVINPSDFHAHGASPQIADLYAHEIVTSRVRLHITDGFKLIYDGGPLDKRPECRVPHESVYVATDPVAMDTIGWGVIDKWRQEKKLPTLAKAGREPTYIRVASDKHRLGMTRLEDIRLREVTL
jgi:uncharacterized protein (DUF362 family)